MVFYHYIPFTTCVDSCIARTIRKYAIPSASHDHSPKCCHNNSDLDMEYPTGLGTSGKAYVDTQGTFKGHQESNDLRGASRTFALPGERMWQAHSSPLVQLMNLGNDWARLSITEYSKGSFQDLNINSISQVLCLLRQHRNTISLLATHLRSQINKKTRTGETDWRL